MSVTGAVCSWMQDGCQTHKRDLQCAVKMTVDIKEKKPPNLGGRKESRGIIHIECPEMPLRGSCYTECQEGRREVTDIGRRENTLGRGEKGKAPAREGPRGRVRRTM